MRNKRTLQRGLALLLAGGMALTSCRAGFGKESRHHNRSPQTAPDGEAATDTTTNGTPTSRRL